MGMNPKTSRVQGSTYFVKVLKRDLCSFCGCKIFVTGEPRTEGMTRKTRNMRVATVDHIHPISRGGQNAWWNFTAACAECNSTKGSRSLLEFMLDRKPRQKEMRGPLTKGSPVDIGFTMPDTWFDPLGIHADS